MSSSGASDGQSAGLGGQFSGHVDAPIHVVVDHPVVVVPEDVHRRLCTLQNAALQLQPGTGLQVLLGWPGYLSFSLCEKMK